MARRLKKNEIGAYMLNRVELHRELTELQADFKDFSNDELVENRNCMEERVNKCLELILETDEDNEI